MTSRGRSGGAKKVRLGRNGKEKGEITLLIKHQIIVLYSRKLLLI